MSTKTITSKLLAEFGVPRNTVGQVPKHRMVEVFENQLYEVGIIRSGKWDGEKTLIRRGWAKFTNLAGDRLVPKNEYADQDSKKVKKGSKTTPGDADGVPPVTRRKSGIAMAEETEQRRKEATHLNGDGTGEGDAHVSEITDELNVEDPEDEDEGGDAEADGVAKYGDADSDLDPDEEDSELQFWNPDPPEGYEWVSAWKINRVFLPMDDDGWIYGNNMKHILKMQKKLRSRSTPSGSYARRRLWYRIMARKGSDPDLPRPFVLPLRLGCFFDLTEAKEYTFMMHVYQNERYSPILLSWGNKFPGHLLFHDPAALTNEDFKQSVRDWSDLEALPAGFKWASDWTVFERPGETGQDGYVYATDFPSFHDLLHLTQLENTAASNVRRRRWVRRMVPARDFTRKAPVLDEMSVPALFPVNGMVHPSVAKSLRRGLYHVDVILVHGLAGSAAETFKGPIRLSKSQTLWPDEYLLSDDKFNSAFTVPAATKVPMADSVRTLVVEHGLFLEAEDPIWNMENALSMLIPALKNALVGCRPIIWIGHSIGGLLIKELLYRSFKSDDNAIFALTRGIVFLGTPHHGTSSINTILDMRITKKTAITEYLKPCMHFHQLQAWFDSTDIEYVNVVENKDIPSKHFSGMLATVLMKFVGLRIVQVNDGMLTMGSEPQEDLNTPIRYNCLADLDHWSLGTIKLGNPVCDQIYKFIRLATARWLREKNKDSRTAWKTFSTNVSNEVFLLSRLLYEIMRTNSPISRTLSALENKTDPAFILSLLKKLTVGSSRQERLDKLDSIIDLDTDHLDRLEDYLRERPLVEDVIGKYRIDMESHLCVLTENIIDEADKAEKMEDMVQVFSTRYFALLSCVDREEIAEAILNPATCAKHVGEMLFWIELARCCKDILVPREAGGLVRDSEYSHEEIEICIEILHGRLMESIADVSENVHGSVEQELNRPAEVYKASIEVAESNPNIAANLPCYAPPPPPPPAAATPLQSAPPPPVPSSAPPIPLYNIGDDDDDLEVVTVPIAPPPPVPPLPPTESPLQPNLAVTTATGAELEEVPEADATEPDKSTTLEDHHVVEPPIDSPMVLGSPIRIDDEGDEARVVPPAVAVVEDDEDVNSGEKSQQDDYPVDDDTQNGAAADVGPSGDVGSGSGTPDHFSDEDNS